MAVKALPGLTLSHSAMSVLEAAEANGNLTVVGSVDELVNLAVPDDQVDAQGYYTVGYEVPGKGFVEECKVCRVNNGIAANYIEPYMRRRDPNCMVIADEQTTDKTTYKERFGEDFDALRSETLEWLKEQPIACFFFRTGLPGEPMKGLAICPANAGFFGLGLALLQGIVPVEEVLEQGDDYYHDAVVYIAPPFRHTKFDGKQVVVHNRRFDDETRLHELFSYNLYPGPSAKKGVYGMLLTKGERDETPWTTAHCSTVQVVTPYDNITTIMHEGASGGGKSEMLEHMHRAADGQLLLGTNVVNGDKRLVSLPRGCDLRPVTDDMALCHPGLQGNGNSKNQLSLMDAEQAWFIRVNHITDYGIDPNLERLTVNPPGPLLFLNIKAKPGATSLIWEHTEDEPGVPCPNPRVVVPRNYIHDIVEGDVSVGIRSFGVRCPPCTREQPTYGILGLFHVLPPSLAWLWRLVAPRGHGNPSIVDQGGMQSEGVGSYWPFATGRRVDQANILLKQIVDTKSTLFVLIPNQHLGCWKVGFSPQWIAREYLARRGATGFPDGELKESRCSLLGYQREKIQVEGQTIGTWFFDVSKQPEVGEEAYDKGAQLLGEFFHKTVKEILHPDLDPLGKEIIEACLNNASLEEYDRLIAVNE